MKGPAAGQAFKLEPWQRRFVEEFSRLNGSGERIYKRGMRERARSRRRRSAYDGARRQRSRRPGFR